MKERYVQFWEALRQLGFTQDNKRLVELSLGTAIEYREVTQVKAIVTSKGAFEMNILKPMFYHNGDMKDAFLRCKLQSKEHMLDCAADVARKSRHHPVVWKEMMLGAIGMLKTALNVAAGGYYALIDNLDSLRSDDRAIACVSDWDRVTSIPKVLYLTFLLRARQLIAHMTENKEETNAVGKLLLELDLLINSEFPSKMIRVVKQEQTPNGALYLYENQIRKRKQLIKHVKLVSVKQKDQKLGKLSNLFAHDDTLYVSVPEHSIEGNYDGVMEFFRNVVKEVGTGRITMKTNPMADKL